MSNIHHRVWKNSSGYFVGQRYNGNTHLWITITQYYDTEKEAWDALDKYD